MTRIKGKVGAHLRDRVGLALLLVVGLVAAISTVHHYGESWDESDSAAYGAASLSAYRGSDDYMSLDVSKYYGPAYDMFWVQTRAWLAKVVPSWTPIDAGHLVNFMAFLVAGASLYAIACRFAEPNVALAVVLLFVTQPVLYGHAFVNQKDIPFMAYFTLAVAAGIVAIDRAGLRPGRYAGQRSSWLGRAKEAAAEALQDVHGMIRRHPAIASGVGFGLFVMTGSLAGLPNEAWAKHQVELAYNGKAGGILNGLFRMAAESANRMPLDGYLAKVDSYAAIGHIMSIGVVLIACMWLAALVVAHWWLPGEEDRNRMAGLIILAGALTGLATSTRVAGPLAGGLVSGYMIYRWRSRSVAPLILYWVGASLACYSTWPFLWAAPVSRFAEAMRVMSRFQAHTLLFEGVALPSSDLPWDYLPRLLGLELTLPAIGLFLVGAVLIIRRLIVKSTDAGLLAIPILWLGTPLIGFELLRTPLYGNIRQALFLVPSLFIVAAVALDALWRWPVVRRIRALPWALVVVFALPGLVAVWSLHPYELAYFNATIGGLQGARGRYHLDPWCTSYREAMGFVNETAKAGSVVGVSGPFESAADFARKDLELVRVSEMADADFVLGCKWDVDNPKFYPAFNRAFEVVRQGVPLAVVLASPGQDRP